MRVPVAISLVGHVAAIALLHQSVPRGEASLVAVALFDRAAPPAAVPAPTPKREIGTRAAEHARPRVHRAARALPPPTPPPPPLPAVQPEPSPVVTEPPVEPELPVVDEGQVTNAAATDLPAGSARPELRRDPDMEAGSCTRGLDYPPAVKQIQQEVVVRLRVELDARGQVSAVQLVERAGGAFDDTAIKAVREHCRFTAALDARGRPVPFTIDDYRFHFRPADFQTPTIGHFLLQ